MTEVLEEVRTTWTTGLSDVLNTGSWRVAFPVYEERLGPCQQGCPLCNRIPDWIRLVRDKKNYEAWLTIVEENPFPAVTGRICHHPCQQGCNRAEYDGSVAIQSLERFLGDLAIKEGWALPFPSVSKDERVAVVGGGPAGLSAACYLNRLGYAVTIFEKRDKLGGLLQYGIPSYRLPKQILEREIARLVDTGIEVRTGINVDMGILSELEEKYQAVFLASGAQKSKILSQLQGDNSQVSDALQFLEEINQAKIPTNLGREVVVIGGGSSAMDVARCVRRLGSSVNVLALENRNSLPAQVEEVEQAVEEGVVLFDCSMIETVTTTAEAKLSLRCVQVTLDKDVPPGILKPMKLPGTEFDIIADNIIQAIGQDVESDFMLQQAGNIIKVGNNYQTSKDGIFAGGDVASNERFVSMALSQGKMAAQSIASWLGGQGQVADKECEKVTFAEINTFYFPETQKFKNKTLPTDERLKDFREIKLAANAEEVFSEVERCFSCGHCTECENCFYFCPDMAVVKEAGGDANYRILEQYCKGCGLCNRECPRGVIVMKEESR